MAHAASTSSGTQDLVLVVGGLLIAALTLALALGEAAAPPDTTSPPVASVTEASGDSRLRPTATLLWRNVAAGMEVHDGDSVFVPPGAAATLRFMDGTELDLDERALVVVEAPRGGERSITLRQGSLSGRAGEGGLVLATAAGEARIGARAEACVELTGGELEVTVQRGEASVRAAAGGELTLARGQRAAAGQGSPRALPAWPVTLTEPDANLRRWFEQAPPALELAWTGEVAEAARVQLARDRLFAYVDAELPATGGRTVVSAPRPGVTWWRIVDGDGRPLSLAQRFTFLEDVPPAAMGPRDGEVVMAPRGAPLTFWWTPLAGVASYVVEVSSSREFERLAMSEEVRRSTVRLSPRLEEGTWYWRVRPLRGGAPGAPSRPSRFRLIHKGIPDAPELLSPEIEVEP
jgi:hypothetical protein